MELTENTLSVLKNFSGINQNILIKQGNVIKTISEARNVLAIANVVEEFPKDVGIDEETIGETKYEDFHTLHPESVVPTLVKALQEAVAKIDALETRIKTLENVVWPEKPWVHSQ